MRQGQQNRRGRGRNNNNNRKGQNPLTRSFESTGPDVKIRGTPAHIAEKYMSLARDASSSGDPVLAENYLQHAEHYNRIIMAFREQQMQQGGGDFANGGMRPRLPASLDAVDEFGDEEGDEFSPEHQTSSAPADQAQPRYEGQHRFEGRPRERNEHYHRQHRERYEPREGRGGYGGGGQERPERGDRGPQGQAPGEQGVEPGQGQPRGEGQRRRDRFVRPQHEQPEFLRRPVRRPRREEAGPGDGEGETPAPAGASEDTSQD
jgi:uncharacterized protein DUF4167